MHSCIFLPETLFLSIVNFYCVLLLLYAFSKCTFFPMYVCNDDKRHHWDLCKGWMSACPWRQSWEICLKSATDMTKTKLRCKTARTSGHMGMLGHAKIVLSLNIGHVVALQSNCCDIAVLQYCGVGLGENRKLKSGCRRSYSCVS